MVVLNWLLFILSILFFSVGIFVIFSCFIALIRFSDFFIRAHAIKISNIYGISFLLLGIGFSQADPLTILQLFAIIILNILITITVVHAVCRIAINNNVPHGSFSRRKYNEMLAQKEKEGIEKRIQEKKIDELKQNNI